MWSPCAATLGRSGHLGLAEVGHSEPLAPRLAALPHAAVLGAATTALHGRRLRTAVTTRVTTQPLPSHCCRIRADPLHLCAVTGPVRVASTARTWASRRRHAIYGTAARGPHRSDTRSRCPSCRRVGLQSWLLVSRQGVDEPSPPATLSLCFPLSPSIFHSRRVASR